MWKRTFRGKDGRVVVDPHTIKIEVYEKALAGYVEYLDRFMYFDRDGIVVESSTERTNGIPLVAGLSFDHVVLYQPLPVEDMGIFQDILNISPPELVNGLVVIAHHTEVFPPPGQKAGQQILEMVGILILIHQHIAELILVIGQHFRLLLK